MDQLPEVMQFGVSQDGSVSEVIDFGPIVAINRYEFDSDGKMLPWRMHDLRFRDGSDAADPFV